MKRFVLFATILFFYFHEAKAITTTWTGASGGNWITPGNWSNGVPTVSDDAVFNTPVTVIFTTSPIDFNSLTINGNSTVTFNTSTTTTFRPHSISAGLPGLLIDAGSSLILDATNSGATTNNTAMNMTIAGGVIGSIYGTLIISSTGASSGTDIKLITSNSVILYGIVTVYSGGSIIIKPNAGNTTSSLSPVPTIVMKNGSVYDNQKNGGSFPNGTWETTSLAKATSPGTSAPTFNGTSYGNLEWNCPLQSNITFFNINITFNDVNLISTNRSDAAGEIRVKTSNSAGLWTMTINGNLTIATNARLVTTASNVTAGNGGKIHLKGNLINSGTIKADGSTSTINELELNGIANQNVSVTDSLYGPINFIMSNAAGATLLSRLTLPYSLTLTNGKIKTDAINILTLAAGAFWTGGSSASFVEGPMRRTGASVAYSMPIGKGSIYAEIGYFTGAGYALTDTFTAEYFRSNPQSIYGNNYESLSPPNNIDHISFVEYWSLQKNAGAFPGTNVRLNVSEYSFCMDSNMDSTFIVRYNAPDIQWKNCGNAFTFLGAPVPPYVTGYIESNGQSLLGIFTLATSLPFAANPLPINLISFDATKLTNTKSSINWELAACCSAAAKFEIQRAGANKSFTTIGTVGGSETNKSYNYIDNGLKNGINYYRLKMIDADGKIAYSRTVAVMNGINGLLLTSLIPTIVANTAELTIASSNQHKLDLIIVDMQGRVMMKRNYTIAAGNTNIELSLASLAAGIYQLTGISAEGKTNTIRFIKQ